VQLVNEGVNDPKADQDHEHAKPPEAEDGAAAQGGPRDRLEGFGYELAVLQIGNWPCSR
jgi:hypothetical protein